MAIETYNLTFTKNSESVPVLYNLGKKFNLVYTLKRAQLSEGSGWVQLALSGEMDEIQRALAELMGQGVLVTPPQLNTLTTSANPMP